MQRAALAHLVAGFGERRPLLVQIARRLFAAIQRVSRLAALFSFVCCVELFCYPHIYPPALLQQRAAPALPCAVLAKPCASPATPSCATD